MCLFENVALFARKLFWALERYICHIPNLLGHPVGVKYQPKRPKLKPTNLVLLINDFLHTLAHIIRTENCFENCWLATCTDFVWINIIDYNDVLQDTTYSHVSNNRVELRILLVGNLQLASKYVVVEVCRFYPFLMTQFKIKTFGLYY